MNTSRPGLPETPPQAYEALCRRHLPRKIHDPAAYQDALEMVDWLVGRELNPDQEDYFDLVSDLLAEYEAGQSRDDGPVSPVELLNFLVEENEVTTRELGALLGVDHSVAARILKGQRSITPEHAKKLGERFAIRPGRFLGLP